MQSVLSSFNKQAKDIPGLLASYRCKTPQELVSKLFVEASIYELQLKKLDQLTFLLNLKVNEKFQDSDSLSSFDNFFKSYEILTEKLDLLEKSHEIDSLIKKSEISLAKREETREGVNSIADYVDSSILLEMSSIEELLAFTNENAIVRKFSHLLEKRDTEIIQRTNLKSASGSIEEAIREFSEFSQNKLDEVKSQNEQLKRELEGLKQEDFFVFDSEIRELLKNSKLLEEKTDLKSKMAKLLNLCNIHIANNTIELDKTVSELVEEVKI